jgi:hypothetical protein
MVADREVASAPAPKLEAGKWCKITAERAGGKLKLSLDGKPVLETDDDDYAVAGRYLALYAWNPAVFRSIRVWGREDPALKAHLRPEQVKLEKTLPADRFYPNRYYWLKKVFQDYVGFLEEGAASDAPIKWLPPPTFNQEAKGLGFEVLPGVEHTLIYDPKPCKGHADEGGNGKYESLEHGTYNHGLTPLLYQDKFIVFWGQHGKDEASDGSRTLAKVGTFNKDKTAIDWGGKETLAELAPPAVKLRRRSRNNDLNIIYEVGASAHPQIINGKLYVSIGFHCAHGWTDELPFRAPHEHGGTIPAAHWADNRDEKSGFVWDIFWGLGGSYVQRWRVEGKTIVPDTSIYRTSAELPVNIIFKINAVANA